MTAEGVKFLAGLKSAISSDLISDSNTANGSRNASTNYEVQHQELIAASGEAFSKGDAQKGQRLWEQAQKMSSMMINSQR
jgi:hypothetical protein